MEGAFTSASANGKQGLIQAADKGTLFPDEIGDMPLIVQAKLLRAIESREVQPIGLPDHPGRYPDCPRPTRIWNSLSVKANSADPLTASMLSRALPPLRRRYGDDGTTGAPFPQCACPKRLGLAGIREFQMR